MSANHESDAGDWTKNAPRDLLTDRPLESEPTVTYSGISARHATAGEPDVLMPPKPKKIRKPKRSITVPSGKTLTIEQYKAQEAKLVPEPPATAGTPPPTGRKVWYGAGIDSQSPIKVLSAEERAWVKAEEDAEIAGLAELDEPEGVDDDAGFDTDRYERLSWQVDDDDLDDRPMWEVQTGLPGGWYEEQEQKRRALYELRQAFEARFGTPPPPGKFNNDDDLALYIQFRLEADDREPEAESALGVTPLCDNCHELPVASKGRNLCVPCDKYRRRNGTMRPPRLFNSHRRTRVGEQTTGS